MTGPRLRKTIETDLAGLAPFVDYLAPRSTWNSDPAYAGANGLASVPMGCRPQARVRSHLRSHGAAVAIPGLLPRYAACMHRGARA
jgi:hypothetical protein